MLRKLPFFGSLANTRKTSVILALQEIAISTIFATIPIWFFPAIYTSFFNNSPSFAKNVAASIEQGDLYIYSSAIVGPLIFAITYNYAAWDEENPSPNASRLGKLTFAFPHGIFFFFSSIFVSMITAICFGLLRFESSGFISAPLNKDSLLEFSMYLYVFSLVCLVLVTIYRNDLSRPPSHDSGEKAFIEEWNNRNAR